MKEESTFLQFSLACGKCVRCAGGNTDWDFSPEIYQRSAESAILEKLPQQPGLLLTTVQQHVAANSKPKRGEYFRADTAVRLGQRREDGRLEKERPHSRAEALPAPVQEMDRPFIIQERLFFARLPQG